MPEQATATELRGLQQGGPHPAAGALSYRQPGTPKRRRVGTKLALYVIAGGAGLLLLAGFLLSSLCRSREPANRVKCASNERQIGQAIALYAQEHEGRYPDRLEDLLLTQDISSEVFVCPSSNDERAPGGKPEEAAANLSKPRHLSYVYLGKGLTTAAPASTPVLYEFLDDHDNDGVNVLFADGHVDYIERTQVQQVLGKDVSVTRPQATNP